MGSYAAVFTYAKVIVIPEQLKSAKEDLGNMDMDINSYNKTSPNSNMNSFNNINLAMIPVGERKKIADQMRTNPNKRLNTVDRLSSEGPTVQMYCLLYYLVFEFDAARDMNEMFSYADVSENNSNNFMNLVGTKIPDDIERGDNNAVSDDYAKLDELLKENQHLNVVARDLTQKLINDLE
ncbi:MAG: hypothetical protein NKF70_08000 [Methanobacterium sp. ERen5]|nr:MAG: hypothetical protein NKF70_08000 [Methanobacterium sp. ERen5]